MQSVLLLLRRYLIFNKRLFKKISFLVILLLVPLLVFAMYTVSTKEESGVMTVSLAMQNPADPLAKEVTDSLLDSSPLIRFISCETPADALTLVENGTADAAWIFPDDMQEKLDRFARGFHSRNAFVKVIERENNVLLLLSHEKLSATLYPYLSFSLYKDFFRDHVITLSELSDDALRAYYDAIEAEGDDIFRFSYISGEDASDRQNGHYLLSPLRGLLSVLIMLGGLAVAMFYMQDEKQGKFHQLDTRSRPLFAFGYHLTAVLNMAIAVLLALFLTKMNLPFLKEIILMTLYVLITVGFCIAVRLLCRDIRVIGAVIPVLLLTMIALCPIFFNVRALPAIQYLLPPFYYLNAVHHMNFVYSMILYAVGIFSFDLLLYKIRYR